jgi:hypothetical protein
MPSSDTLPYVAAGVGIGAAAAYVVFKLTSPKPKVPVVDLVERDAEFAPTIKKWSGVLDRAKRLSKERSVTEMPPEPAKPSDSSSNLAAHHLSAWQEDPDSFEVWPRPEANRKNLVLNPMAVARPHMNFLNPNERVQHAIIVHDSKASLRSHALDGGALRGNACKHIYWEPSKVKAALVTCGGLCPGLNSIIQGVTNCLWRDYGVRDIVGITAGYNGLSAPELHPSIPLTPETVDALHLRGGSMLKAGRGGFDAIKICDTLRKGGFTHLFVIGGDGTQFAGHLLYEECRKQNLEVSVVGVPKSIDNDVLFVDRTFGFDSAVEAAAGVIRSRNSRPPSHLASPRLLPRPSQMRASLRRGSMRFCSRVADLGCRGCRRRSARSARRRRSASEARAKRASLVAPHCTARCCGRYPCPPPRGAARTEAAGR